MISKTQRMASVQYCFAGKNTEIEIIGLQDYYTRKCSRQVPVPVGLICKYRSARTSKEFERSRISHANAGSSESLRVSRLQQGSGIHARIGPAWDFCESRPDKCRPNAVVTGLAPVLFDPSMSIDDPTPDS